MKGTGKTRLIAACGILAAMYAVITLITTPLSYGLVQFRLSEALVVLCAFEPMLGIGITLGCFLSNLFSTVTALDMVIGTLATALACLWTGRCRRPWLVPLPNILLNGLLVGGMLAFVLFPHQLAVGFAIAFGQVSFGELVVMYGLGLPLYLFARRTNLVEQLLQ